jgi:hypothetical protein|tara:strand:- start:5308 stop:5598 length:291 start_codon:yes stop_codon:yes gene_type:complete
MNVIIIKKEDCTDDDHVVCFLGDTTLERIATICNAAATETPDDFSIGYLELSDDGFPMDYRHICTGQYPFKRIESASSKFSSQMYFPNTSRLPAKK